MKTLLTLLFASTALFATANVWRVNNNDPSYILGAGGPCGEANVCAHCFSSLQDAIDCAEVLFGDTLYVEASPNRHGNILLDKQLTIIGAGYFLEDNPDLQCSDQVSEVNNVVFVTGSDGSVLKGLSVLDFNNQSNTGRIYFHESSLSNITVDRCYIQKRIDFTATGVTFSGIKITRNFIGGSINESLESDATENILGISIENNIIVGGVNFNDNVNATGMIKNNVIGSNMYIHSGLTFVNNICTSTNMAFPQNSNNTNNVHHNCFASQESNYPYLIDPSNHFGLSQTYLFPNFGETEDLESVYAVGGSCSECLFGEVVGGEDTALMGVYGGLEPYIRAGIPAIPTVFEKANTSEAFPGGVINAIISAKAHN